MSIYTATDHKGRTYEASNPNDAGIMALDASHSSKRETLVCVQRTTDDGNPYVVPVGWFTREMWRSLKAQRAESDARRARMEAEGVICFPRSGY